MEKRKVFKISIIDKEISRVEFDRNTFYTSDSELSLVFKLIEKNYKYEHGEILLYNEDDKSFITRPITKIENDFVYELDLDIIPHYGKWKAQLQLVKDGDVYTSKPFEFVIENDLSNLAPQPTLTDINNWATLKQSANELIEEMQNIIVDIEKSELERINQEKYRKQSELERESKENQRQIVEHTRVNKEIARQQAESERVDKENIRQQNESIRVSAEEQRKIDHANRSAELDGKANKKQEDWITPTLLNGWVKAQGFNVGYYKDEFGIVRVRGRITSGIMPSSMFILPIGYRPKQSYTVPMLTGSKIDYISVTPSGSVSTSSTSSNSLVVLDSIQFRAEE